MRNTALLCLLCVMVCFTRPAAAATHSVSYSTWTLAGDSVTLKFMLPVTEANRLVEAELPLLTTARLRDYLLQKLTIKAAGRDCPAIDQGYDIGQVDPLAVGADLYGFEIVFRCGELRDLVLHDGAMFDRIPGHVNFARIQIGDHFVERLFTRQEQELRIASALQVPAAGIQRYLQLGAGRLLIAADRLCFLATLLLLWQSSNQGWRRAGLVCGALGLGYALAMVTALSDWVQPRPAMLEAAIGGLVLAGIVVQVAVAGRAGVAMVSATMLSMLALLAALLWGTGTAALLLLGLALLVPGLIGVARSAPLVPMLGLAAAFAFVDGFVLPAELAPLQLRGAALARLLVGVELGALAMSAVLLLAAIGLFTWLRSRRFALQQLLQELIVTGCGGLAAFWLLSRLHP